MKRKLVVLSFDALQTGDVELLSKMPYFSKIMKRAAFVSDIREIYPTLTYPIHTTIVTGVHPSKHGIMHNQKASINPDAPDFSIMGSDWYWEKENIKVKTLADAVWEAGGEVATVLWPVTAGEKRGWNVPEIWPVKVRGEDPRAVYEKSASKNVMSEYYNSLIGKYNWKDNEDMIYYGVEIALKILREKKPDLFLCHVIHLDHIRHMYGDQCREVEFCLRELDIVAGRFIKAVEEAGELENTNFVILGDHGQIDIETVFNLNTALREMGFIREGENGKAEGFDAYSFSSGFSAHIMLGEPENGELAERVYTALCEIQAKYPQYIERIYTADEVLEEEGLSGEFSFVVEGTKGTLFRNETTGPLIFPYGLIPSREYKAMHGHHPDKGDKPPFIAFGPDIREGVRISRGDMLDICPTLTRLLGVELEGMEGEPFPIFRNYEEIIFANSIDKESVLC